MLSDKQFPLMKYIPVTIGVVAITHFISGVYGELYLLVIEYLPTTVFIIKAA